MAYIPPHKRHSNDPEKPLPSPVSLALQFKTSLNKPSGSKFNDRKIVYSRTAISKWFPLLFADTDVKASQFASAVRLQETSIDSPVVLKLGEKSFTLVLDDHFKQACNENAWNILKNPWLFVAEAVFPDLLSSFEIVRNEMEGQKVDEIKPLLVVRFGKVLFHGLDFIGRKPITEINLERLRRSFNTNVSSSFMDYVLTEAVPKAGLNFQEDKNLYHVKLSDKMQPDSILTCKCFMTKDCKSLKLHRIEVKQVRHMVNDISCCDKNLDMRVMLFAKRTITDFTDDEIDNIRSLINSAVLDLEVKGGLRWAFGKDSSDRYSVVGAWHTKTKVFRNSLVKLKVRDADRFSFETSVGEVTREVYLKLHGIISLLQNEKPETDSIFELFKSNLEMIWNLFMCQGSAA